MLQRIILVLVLLPVFSSVHARGFDMSLSNETAQFVYLFDSNTQIGIGGADMGAGFFFNEADDIMGTFSLLVTGSPFGKKAWQLGAGAKAFVAELDRQGSDSAAAIGIGGKLSYIMPSRLPMAIYLEAYIAPEVTSFGDNEDFSEINIGYEVEVAPSTRVYLGYRKIETDLDDLADDYELDDKVHFGVRLTF